MQPETSNLAEATAQLARTEQYLSSDPGNRNLLAAVIDQQLALGRLQEADEHARAALARYPGDPFFQSRLGNVLTARQHWAEAAAVFEPLLAAHAQIALAYNLAHCYFWRGRYAEAADVLAPYAGAADIWPDAVTLLLRALHHAGRMDEAVALVARHEAACRADATFLSVASVVCMDAGDAAQAQRLSEMALALAGPEQPLEALMVSGSLALARFDTDTAMAHFRQVLARHPQEGRSWAGMGMGSLLANDLAGAQSQLEQAVALLPTHIGTWHLLGWCKLFAGDLAGARQVFEHALSLDRNFGESHGALAVALARQGDRAGAALCVERALGLERQGLSARYAQMILSGQADDPLVFRTLALKLLSTQAGLFGGDLAQMVEGQANSGSRSTDEA